ncbi:MAG: hypothetical protein FWG64_10065 [Firmicutes bacterium]|nr:hypothetical protein [Bacillota bacterium]
MNVFGNESVGVFEVDGINKALMEQTYGSLIEGYNRQIISPAMHNTAKSGSLRAGHTIHARYANSIARDYGTTLQNLAADPLREQRITVPIKAKKEIVEFYDMFDQQSMPDFFNEVISGRNTNHADTMARMREEDFFQVARDEGTQVIPQGTNPDEQLENLVLQLQTLDNEFFKGIDRSMIYVVMSDTAYSRLRLFLNREIINANVDSAAERVGVINGVKLYSTPHLPVDVSMVAMARGAIAHPHLVLPYEVIRNPFKRQNMLGTAFVLTAKAVMPDTIFWVGV